MAKIIKGKDKGKEVDILQFANDWFSIRDREGKEKVVNPTMLQLTEDEATRVVHTRNIGMMPYLYEMTPKYTFKKRRLN